MPDWPIAFWLMFNHLFVVLIFNVFLPKNDCLVAWNGLEPFGAVWTPAEMSEISILHRPTRPQPNVVEKAQDKGHMGKGSVLHTRTPFLNICLVQVGQHWATQKKDSWKIEQQKIFKDSKTEHVLEFWLFQTWDACWYSLNFAVFFLYGNPSAFYWKTSWVVELFSSPLPINSIAILTCFLHPRLSCL